MAGLRSTTEFGYMTRTLVLALCALACMPLPALAGTASDLDPAFGGDGRKTLKPGSDARNFAEAVLLHSSGRIVVGGNSGSSWALAALNPADGSLVGTATAGGGFGEDGPGVTFTEWRGGSLSALA